MRAASRTKDWLHKTWKAFSGLEYSQVLFRVKFFINVFSLESQAGDFPQWDYGSVIYHIIREVSDSSFYVPGKIKKYISSSYHKAIPSFLTSVIESQRLPLTHVRVFFWYFSRMHCENCYIFAWLQFSQHLSDFNSWKTMFFFPLLFSFGDLV